MTESRRATNASAKVDKCEIVYTPDGSVAMTITRSLRIVTIVVPLLSPLHAVPSLSTLLSTLVRREKHRAEGRDRSRLKEKRDAPVVGDGDVGFPRGDGARACFFAAALGRRRAFDVHSERPSVFFFFSF